MGGSKGSTTQKSTQTNEPPAWAKPLFERAAGDAMDLYNSGSGYNVYRGPTQAFFSPQKLQGLNKAMQMTGGGPAITNENVFGQGNSQIAQLQAMITQQQQQQAQIAAQRAAAKAAAAEAAAKQQANNARYVRDAHGRLVQINDTPNSRGQGMGSSGGWGQRSGSGGSGSGWK